MFGPTGKHSVAQGRAERQRRVAPPWVRGEKQRQALKGRNSKWLEDLDEFRLFGAAFGRSLITQGCAPDGRFAAGLSSDVPSGLNRDRATSKLTLRVSFLITTNPAR
jgi:hypothetical protein